MKGNSNQQPTPIERIGSKVQVRWNIIRNDRKDENGNLIESWDYDYVNADSLTRDAVIRAVIRDKYPMIDDEIAVINNQVAKPDEYNAYQNHRALAKQIADAAI